jgi:hypothetical protein
VVAAFPCSVLHKAQLLYQRQSAPSALVLAAGAGTARPQTAMAAGAGRELRGAVSQVSGAKPLPKVTTVHEVWRVTQPLV